MLFFMIVFLLLTAYAVTAMTTNIRIRVEARKAGVVGILPPQSRLAERAAAGQTGSQLTSFALHLLLLFVGLSALMLSIISYNVPSLPFGLGELATWALVLIPVLTPITIIVNAFWIYSKPIAAAEQSAFVNKNAPLLLKVEHLVAWFTWIGYTIFSIMVTISLLLIQLFPETFSDFSL